VFLKLCVTAAR